MSDPSRLLVAYYGDDFSGSTDVMESLSLAGIPTVLFLEPPTAAEISRFPDVRAVGVAGMTRSVGVAQMDHILPAVFRDLARLNPELIHYKTCSTFDSSPTVGSIGRAIDCGIAALGSQLVPVVVGAPVLGRYVAFGNLFARSGLDNPFYRLDRHPTMSRHPVTPMREADLRLVLAEQTERRVGLVDTTQLQAGSDAVLARLNELRREGCQIALFDTVSSGELATIGGGLWNDAGPRPRFAVGSSGVEYALVAHWHATQPIAARPLFAAEPTRQIVVVSGSCSPVTGRQIAAAVEAGFVDLPADTSRLLADDDAEFNRLAGAAIAQVERGASVIVHTSRGPDDPRLEIKASDGQTPSPGIVGERLGTQLGRILRQIVAATGVRRLVVAGGDTSGFVSRQLGIRALQLAAPVAPGSPLCRIGTFSADHPLEGAEIVFKGGQVGRADFFVRVREGAASIDTHYHHRNQPSSTTGETRP